MKNKSGGSIHVILLLFILCFLGLFLFSMMIVFQQAAKTKNSSLPEFCVPAELQIIKESSSDTANLPANQIFFEEKAALEKSIKECALLATLHPQADRPEELIRVSLPTSLPLPTPKISLGIQNMILLPSRNFIPTGESQNNYWAGVVNGQTIQILAGILRDHDETWREDHPEWVEMGSQGAVEVVDSNWVMIVLVQTPTRNGYVHFVRECDSSLLLQSDDGAMFVFNLPEFIFNPVNLSNHSSSTRCQ